MPHEITPTHDVVYSKSGLQHMMDAVKQKLVLEGNMDVEGAPELYKYQWIMEEHGPFVRDVLQFRDIMHVESIVDSEDSEGSDSAQRCTISYYARRKMKRSGLRSPKDSGRYQPLLLLLRSGTQWFGEKQMAVIVLIEVEGGDATKVEILSRDGEASETVKSTITMSVGYVIQIYGPHGWRPQEQAVSFLFLYYDVVKREAGATSDVRSYSG
ncbi:hypothetical protein LZ31DRAFT_560919 [Colletotrichum somersetense]|nr:hypothetical protein LZ31DRAFT_560919 [Colletotrichum somersetense]